ncbi:MAG: fused MFS/spermidine synthase [Planctomycetes bacterium]|nr:fused MFS/spermidine synthase [Planctomycetota bacterium]
MRVYDFGCVPGVMVWLYTLTILLGSCLLFLVQPLCAKMLLPLLGGTPAVWNTCMVFFQAGLLAGYAYAHILPARLGVGRHAIFHLGLLIAAYFLLPIRLPDEVRAGWHPVLFLLVSLLLSVGLPFVLLAAGAPLVQRWFVLRFQNAPRDPYFLYAASNFGSFLALGLFPFVLEPYWSLGEQSEIWAYAFLVMTALLAFCVPMRQAAPTAAPSTSDASDSPTWKARGRWIALALIPSSLLLSVTTHLTTDVASIPLLWLIPMAIYLLTFTLAFSQRHLAPHEILTRFLPLVVIVLLVVLASEATEPMPLVMALHLAGFFWLALTCHGELARTRPPASHLTDFYLCLALGGVLGGSLNALIAPLLFPGLYEYPAMIVLACVFAQQNGLRATRQDWFWALGIGAATAGVILVLRAGDVHQLDSNRVNLAVIAAALVVCYLVHQQHARFALCIAAVVVASSLDPGIHGATAYRERSYFGIHRVTKIDGFHRLVHGSTVHGQQSLDPERRHLPLTYYSHEGPIGDVFRLYKDDPRLNRVGVVGLGTGSVAAYAQPGQTWTFLEIDPTVKRIAENPKLFTYLKDAQGTIRIEIGDARLQLRKPGNTFGLLIVDAFGSDAIPMHLLTREALAVYLDRLTPGGVLAFHISNGYVNLESVLANLAADTDPPCVALVRRHRANADEKKFGIMNSDWLVIAQKREDVRPLLDSPAWRPAQPRPELPVWTDDRSNLFQVFRWRGPE